MRGAFPANYVGGVWNGWRPGWVWLRRSCHSNRRELVFDRKRRIRKKLLHLHIANSSQWSSVCVCVTSCLECCCLLLFLLRGRPFDL